MSSKKNPKALKQLIKSIRAKKIALLKVPESSSSHKTVKTTKKDNHDDILDNIFEEKER